MARWRAPLSGVAASLFLGHLDRLRRFPDGDQPQGERFSVLAADADGPVDHARGPATVEQGDQINPAVVALAPGGALPRRADHDIGTRREHGCDAIRLEIGPVADADLALDHRDPVKRLAAMLVGQLEEAEAFMGQIERGVDAPDALALLAFARLGHRCAVNQPDQPAPARPGRRRRQDTSDQQREPVPALPQPVKQRHVRHIG
jgi:hypothetical protein